MTANRKQKKTTRSRAAAEGVPYLVARRAETGDGPGPSARALAEEVASLVEQRGWPVETEPTPQFADWLLYTGPMRIAVSDPGLDPDDDLVLGLDEAARAAAEQVPAGPVWLSAPFLGERPDLATPSCRPGRPRSRSSPPPGQPWERPAPRRSPTVAGAGSA